MPVQLRYEGPVGCVGLDRGRLSVSSVAAVPAKNGKRAGSAGLSSGPFFSSSAALAMNSSQNEPAISFRSAGVPFLAGATASVVLF